MKSVIPVSSDLSALFQRLDQSPDLYWLVAWSVGGFLLLLIGARLFHDWHRSDERDGRRALRIFLHPLTFVFFAAVAILAFRWPMLFVALTPNPDETQLAAAALTYWMDPVPWRSVDIHTSGPINAYFLWPAQIFTGRMDLVTIRITALFAQLAAALASYGVARRLTAEGVARLSALPFIAFVGFVNDLEFIQYSSEQASLCLLALSTWLIGDALGSDTCTENSRRCRLLLAGLFLGCLPFAKLQAGPLGVAIGFVGILIILLFRSRSLQNRWQYIAILMGGALLTVGFFATALTIYQLWGQFRGSYIVSNFVYAARYADIRLHLLQNFATTFLHHPSAQSAYFLGTTAFAAFAVYVLGFRAGSYRRLTVAAWLLLAVAIWSIIQAGRPFVHYFQLALLPTAWLGTVALAACFERAEGASLPWRRRAKWLITGAFLTVTLLPQVTVCLQEPNPSIGNLVKECLVPKPPIAVRLTELAKAGDRLTVWGWFPRLHLDSKLPQGTREAHSYHQIEQSVMSDFYRQRYLRDLTRNLPTFFVDAVCPGSFGYHNRSENGPHVFPALTEFLNEHYRLFEDVDGYLIYLRTDRFEDVTGQP